jgi:hypothetical protein
MNFVNRNDSRVTIKQIPFVLLFVAALFSLPFLAFSLFHIVRGTDAEGKYFCLFLGLFFLWLFLEFVATRERIVVDLHSRTMTRTVRGIFRNKLQLIDLAAATNIGIELVRDNRGKRYEYVYVYLKDGKSLVNTPFKKYLKHEKFAKLLSEITSLPYSGRLNTVK